MALSRWCQQSLDRRMHGQSLPGSGRRTRRAGAPFRGRGERKVQLLLGGKKQLRALAARQPLASQGIMARHSNRTLDNPVMSIRAAELIGAHLGLPITSVVQEPFAAILVLAAGQLRVLVSVLECAPPDAVRDRVFEKMSQISRPAAIVLLHPSSETAWQWEPTAYVAWADGAAQAPQELLDAQVGLSAGSMLLMAPHAAHCLEVTGHARRAIPKPSNEAQRQLRMAANAFWQAAVTRTQEPV